MLRVADVNPSPLDGPRSVDLIEFLSSALRIAGRVRGCLVAGADVSSRAVCVNGWSQMSSLYVDGGVVYLDQTARRDCNTSTTTRGELAGGRLNRTAFPGEECRSLVQGRGERVGGHGREARQKDTSIPETRWVVFAPRLAPTPQSEPPVAVHPRFCESVSAEQNRWFRCVARDVVFPGIW